MAVGKEIKKKIGSVSNTQKITSAMQMVAASKMRRTQEKMREGKPYAEKIRAVISHLANANPEYRHIYMEAREVKRIGYIVVSTDKGLCGGLNVNLFRILVRDMAEWHAKGIESDLGLIGNKAAAFFRSVGGNITAAINGVGEVPTLAELIGGIKVMLDAYEKGRIDRLFIVSNDFVNTMTQRPVIRQLLPLAPAGEEELKHRWDYIYEPEARELIEALVTRFIESQVYQAVVENGACEQAAKMIAMKNATENAESSSTS
jgi:F-type H+-transporting ATPase subunit gamma